VSGVAFGSCPSEGTLSKTSLFGVKQLRTESQGVVQTNSSNSVAADVYLPSIIRHVHSKKDYSESQLCLLHSFRNLQLSSFILAGL